MQSKSASLIEDMNSDDPDSAARLNAQLIDSVTDDVIGQYNLAAPNFRELRRRYPRETEEFIVPILRDLQLQKVLAPDARVTSQVLQTEFKPTQEFSKKIDAVLAKFDSDDFQTREQAAKDLAALGQPAALALAHADRKSWSIDRQSGVDAFLSQYKSMPADDAAKLRHDPIFLLDCLYSEDAPIREKAAALLQTITGMSLNSDDTGTARDESIDHVFGKIFPPLATRPASRSK